MENTCGPGGRFTSPTMAKTGASRGRTRQRKRLNPEVVDEEEKPVSEAIEENDSKDTKLKTGDVQDDQAESGPADVKSEHQAKDEPEEDRTEQEDKPETQEKKAEMTSTEVQTHPEVSVKGEEELKNGSDAEMEAVIEVKSNAPTVSMSWEKTEQQDEDGPAGLTRTDNTEISNEEPVKMTSTDVQEDAQEEVKDDEEPTEDKEIKVIEDKGPEEAEDKDDVEMESSGSDHSDCEKPEKEAESDGEEEDERDKKVPVHGKRKAKSSIDSSPSKKVKLINDGYCLYVGNLDNSKYYEEIRNALAKYFMTQSILVQDIRLDKAKKHAFVELASEMDLTKALTLNGQKLLDKPLKIAKAKVKEVDLVKKKKDPQEVQKNKNERCIHVENIPSSATREDLLKVFPKAIAVRFLGGTDSPSKGVAFVEFQSKGQANAARSQSRMAQLHDCVLRVNVVRENSGVRQTKSDSKKNKTGEAPPSDTLFVGNLPVQVQKKHLQKIFKNAVQITIPQSDGKSKRYAFVEFASMAHAEKALKSCKNSAIQKRPLKVQFGFKSKTDHAQVPSKTLIVLGLHEKTTADTLTEAFDGALTSRIFVDKDTGLSRKFGFVDFESMDSCIRAKESAEDVEIDGSKVTVAFARPKSSQAPDTGERSHYRGAKRGQAPEKGHDPGRPLLKKKKCVK